MTPEALEAYREKKAEAKKEREKHAKMMDLQYFLEMVDTKHRYGSNLRAYHNEWKKADTNENFFYWLDEGEGKNIELPTVSRERLDSEQVRYLSREERQQYLVKVDSEGRLCWAKNGERLTTSIEYKDSVDGVVPSESHVKTWSSTHANERHPSSSLGSSSRSSSSSHSFQSVLSDSSAQAKGEHYVNHELENAKGVQKLTHVSAAAILNQLLRKTVKPNTWIFVADTSFRLYVGIKKSGAFQHSSFLHGSRILAAGLIKIKDGQLRRLSPLSGHYRPPTKNFRLFVHSLKDAGVDMSHVSISRSYAVLVGLEAYTKTRKKFKHGIEHVRDGHEKILNPEEAKKKEEERIDRSKSAQREREFLESEKERLREEKKNMTLVERFKRKLHLSNETKSEKSADTAILSGTGEDAESAIPPDGKR
jgi:hypothetical protein